MTERIRCPECNQYPPLRQNGTITPHRYAWPHRLAHTRCPASNTRPNQSTLNLEEPK